MKETYKKQGYTITERTDFFDEEYGITPQVNSQLSKLYETSQDEKECNNAIEHLQRLILEYPKCPILKNYLSTAYRTLGNKEKAKEVNEHMLDVHPNYLFARLGKATNHLENDELDEMLDVLGKDLCIKKLHPGRTIFHLSEISSFLGVTILYYNAVGNKKKKAKQLSILEKICPEKVDEILKQVAYRNILKMQKEMESRWKPAIENREEVPLPTSQNTVAPVFQHAEINNLYQYGMDISMDKLNEILALPRKSLIADLELVLIDAVDRYNYFISIDYDDCTHTFPFHALYLLMELKAEESLQVALSLFINHYELTSYWFEDLLTETLWQCFFVLGFNDLQAMKRYLLTPHLNQFTKCPVTEALSQIVLHHPERRNDIIDVYTEILNYYINTPEEESDLDPEYMAMLIGDIIDANIVELLPLIKTLYEMDYVCHHVNGDYNSAVRHMNDQRDRKRKIETLEELYRFCFGANNIPNNYATVVDEEDDDYEYVPPRSFIPAPPASKIGRNDPCPCGSGKKYKKCCLS